LRQRVFLVVGVVVIFFVIVEVLLEGWKDEHLWKY
jgi:hypothetical protein